MRTAAGFCRRPRDCEKTLTSTIRALSLVVIATTDSTHVDTLL